MGKSTVYFTDPLNILITKPPKDLHGTIPILLQTDIVSEKICGMFGVFDWHTEE